MKIASAATLSSVPSKTLMISAPAKAQTMLKASQGMRRRADSQTGLKAHSFTPTPAMR